MFVKDLETNEVMRRPGSKKDAEGRVVEVLGFVVGRRISRAGR